MTKPLEKQFKNLSNRGLPEVHAPHGGNSDNFTPRFISVINKGSFHLVLIALTGLIAYSNTFSAPFIWDDQAPNIGIVGNPIITTLDNFFSSSIGYQYNPRRYIGYLSLAMNYRLGGLDVTGYHVVNLMIHVMNAILVYVLVTLTFRTVSAGQLQPKDSRYAALIALFSGLIFVVHPLQTEAVTYTYQRFAILATFFYLLAIVLYVHGRLTPSKTKAWGSLILSALSVILAMKTKEIAFTLPVVIVLYEYLFLKVTSRMRIFFAAVVLATLLIIPLGLLHTGKPIPDMIRDIDAVTRVQAFGSRWIYLATEMRVIATYLRLLVLPVNQNLDYDFPLYRSFLDPAVFLSCILHLSLFALGVYLLRTSRKDQDGPAAPLTFRIAAFGIFWFFITLSVESSVIPIADLISEHRVYLPSVGILIAMTALAVAALDRFRVKPVAIVAVFGCAVGILMTTAFMRNQLFGSAVTIWSDTAAKSPGLSRPFFNLGNAYSEKGDFEKAIGVYQHALSLPQKVNIVTHERAKIYNNLGCAYSATGRYNEAIEIFSYVLKNIDPDSIDSSLNLGAALVCLGRYREAIPVLRQVLAKKADWAAAHYNLALAYHGISDEYNAQREYALARNLSAGRPRESSARP